MPIVQNVPRKQGKIQQRPTAPVSKRGTRVFPPNFSQASSNVGDVTNPGNPPDLTANALDYNNRVSTTGGATNPTGTQRDTATQGYYPPMVPNGTVGNVPQQESTNVQPHEKGTFFASQKPLNVTKVRQSGGVAPNSDSAFHPVVASINRPRRYPTPSGERTSAESFGSMHTLSGDKHSDVGGSRWSRIKRSASDAPLPVQDNMIPQTARQSVGKGGWIESTSRAPVQNQSHIGGGGFGSQWTPINRPAPWRPVQTERRTQAVALGAPPPFPQKLGCKKGCK
jgi:hypothetical protein